MLFYFVYFTYVCFVYPSGFNSFYETEKKYHTVETFKKNTTRSKHLKKIPHGRNISKSNRKIVERGKIDTSKNTYYTGPLNFLAWHRHLKWRG